MEHGPTLVISQDKSDHSLFGQDLCHLVGPYTVALKGDNEPVLNCLYEKAKRAWPHTLLIQNTPRYSAASHGSIENMIRQAQGQARTLRSVVELAYAIVIDPTHKFLRLMRHCGFLIKRSHVAVTKTTSYFDQFSQEYNDKIIPFAETVLYQVRYVATGHEANKQRRYKADLNWHKGMWCGKADNSV